MTPKSAMRSIISEVEALTGYPCTVQEVASLPVLATAKAASSKIPFTLIRIREDISPMREYTICFQCGFVIRQASLPQSDHWDVTASQKGRQELANAIRQGGGELDVDSLNARVDHLIGGIVTQLRSVPIGLRIDQWIRGSYPVLAEQQILSVERQLEDNAAVLSPNVKTMIPERVYSASVGMNAAMAVHWAKECKNAILEAPYKVAGYVDVANALLRILNEMPSDPNGDKALIDAWAAELDISGWHEFVARMEK